MLNLPETIINMLNPFAPVFYGETTWEKAKTLLVRAILAPGKRTVSAVLRVMGLGEETRFADYHHVLSRAVWSSREASYRLLKLLLAYLDQGEALLVFGIDETLERRWGAKIAARGIYRDPVRSSKSHFIKASGLRWVSLMWLAAILWAERLAFHRSVHPMLWMLLERDGGSRHLTHQRGFRGVSGKMTPATRGQHQASGPGRSAKSDDPRE